METVGNLNCVRSLLFAALGVRTGSIPNNDLDTGVMTEPICKYLGGAILEQINRQVRLKIEQQRAILPLLPAQGNVIDTQHPRPTRVVGVCQVVQEP